MAITKLGKDLLDKETKNYLNGAEGVGGLALLRNALASGQLTGRQTLYHGTDKDSAASIRKSGLQPTTDANAVNTSALKADAERYNKSLGKAYTTGSALEGLTYAYQTNAKKGGKGMSVVKINAPTWKMKTVMNPEVDMPYGEWKKRLGIWGDLMPEYTKKTSYKSLRNAVVFDGGVGKEYIKGSDAYKGLSLKEFAEYLKARPKTFAVGGVKALLGAGTLGHSIYELINRNKKN